MIHFFEGLNPKIPISVKLLKIPYNIFHIIQGPGSLHASQLAAGRHAVRSELAYATIRGQLARRRRFIVAFNLICNASRNPRHAFRFGIFTIAGSGDRDI